MKQAKPQRCVQSGLIFFPLKNLISSMYRYTDKTHSASKFALKLVVKVGINAGTY